MANEVIRKANEAIRKANEVIRMANEVIRKATAAKGKAIATNSKVYETKGETKESNRKENMATREIVKEDANRTDKGNTTNKGNVTNTTFRGGFKATSTQPGILKTPPTDLQEIVQKPKDQDGWIEVVRKKKRPANKAPPREKTRHPFINKHYQLLMAERRCF